MLKTSVRSLAGAIILAWLGTALVVVSVPGPALHDGQQEILGMLLGKPEELVRCLAFAPDGKTLATGGGSGGTRGEIKLWELATGTERAAFPGNRNGVYAVAFAPDGRTLATASLDHVVTLWDLTTGQELARAPLCVSGSLCPACFLSPAWTPDGQALALVGWSGDPGRVLLWRLASEPERPLAGGSGPVAFSADGRHLGLWRLATDPRPTGPGPVPGQELASAPAAEDLPAMHIWHLPTEGALSLRGDQNFVWALAFSPDGRTLASGGFDETVKFWDVSTGQQRATLWGHTDQVGALAFAPDGQLLASGSHDATVRLWDCAAGRELAAHRGHTRRITCVAFSPDGQWLASGSYDRTVRLWPLARVK